MQHPRPLKLWCWEGYDQASILEPYSARHGVSVSAQTLTSDASAAHVARTIPGSTDILNINNAYITKDLYPAGRIEALKQSRYEDALADMLPQFERLFRWAWSPDGSTLLGLCQRFGAFNLVVNTRCISAAHAIDEGFALVDDAALPFGVLRYDDFNIFHICIAADINPFLRLSEQQVTSYTAMANYWLANAVVVSNDHHALNTALLERRIAYYLSGGTFTASPARIAGHWQIEAITPRSGPIDGRGGIAFTEITSKLVTAEPHNGADGFLDYMLEAQTAAQIAMLPTTCNPVAQMGSEKVMRRFSREQLAAIQWETLEQDIARCAVYDLVPDHARLLDILQHADRRRSELDR